MKAVNIENIAVWKKCLKKKKKLWQNGKKGKKHMPFWLTCPYKIRLLHSHPKSMQEKKAPSSLKSHQK